MSLRAFDEHDCEAYGVVDGIRRTCMRCGRQWVRTRSPLRTVLAPWRLVETKPAG